MSDKIRGFETVSSHNNEGEYSEIAHLPKITHFFIFAAIDSIFTQSLQKLIFKDAIYWAIIW